MKQLFEKEKYLIKIIQEFKTPAIAQSCALEALLETAKQKFSKDELELIELTLNSCNYMRKLIDTFLNVLKLNLEKLSLKYTKFNLVELLNEVLDGLNLLLKYNGLKVELKCKKEVIINADSLQIKKAIENILLNSIKNSCKNSIIEINIEIFKNEILFEVKNKSPYIEEELLNGIFNKNKKQISVLKNPSKEFGLYLSKEIINAHFGRMLAKSDSDNTNILGFYLPRK